MQNKTQSFLLTTQVILHIEDEYSHCRLNILHRDHFHLERVYIQYISYIVIILYKPHKTIIVLIWRSELLGSDCGMF